MKAVEQEYRSLDLLVDTLSNQSHLLYVTGISLDGILPVLIHDLEAIIPTSVVCIFITVCHLPGTF